jgi:pyruvate dehydrogenase E2 component (dihydrolipoamide acetyltransferase)
LIAERLSASRQHTVPVTLTTSADVSALVQLRDEWKTRAAASACPSYQDVIVALVAATLSHHPLLAARWDGDEIVVPSNVRFGIGFAIDTAEGLLVAVLADVCALSISAVAERSRALVDRARAGRLTAAEMEGSVFTVTNLGAFGIDAFTPVIHDRQAAILGLGTIRREPTFTTDGQIVAQHRMVLSLTFDHRIVDGAPAARFLQDLVKAIGQPPRWLVDDQPESDSRAQSP